MIVSELAVRFVAVLRSNKTLLTVTLLPPNEENAWFTVTSLSKIALSPAPGTTVETTKLPGVPVSQLPATFQALVPVATVPPVHQ